MNRTENQELNTKVNSGQLFSAATTESNGLDITGVKIPIQAEKVTHLKGTKAFQKIKLEGVVYLSAVWIGLCSPNKTFLKLLWAVGKQHYFLLKDSEHSPHTSRQATRLPQKLQIYQEEQNE